MVALDAVMQCVLGIILDDDSFFKGTFRSLIWAVVWFSYLKQSKKVKRVIPEETRCWKVTEIILLIVFFLSSVAFCTAMNNFTKDPTNSHLMSKEYLIKQAIEEMNKTLPSDIDGILLENAELQGLMVVYNYKFPNNSVTEMDLGYIKKYSIAHKQEILQGFATETDKELISFYELIFDNGYDLCYYFKDKNDQLIYSIVTTIADYHRAVECGNNYRCDRNAWSEVIKQTNNDLPTQYMGDGTLTNVSVDFERNVVTYEVELPELEDYLLRFAMTEEYLEDYIMRNLGDLSDYIWTMAGIDKMSLKYHFVTSMGIDHATVTIPYESYRSQI